MTSRVRNPRPRIPDEWFARQCELRAELIVARMFAAHWLRRVRELEQELPPDSPLRTAKPSDA